MFAVLLLSFFASIMNLILLKVFVGFSAWNGFIPFLGGVILNALLAPLIFQGVRRVFIAEMKAS